LSLIKGLKLSSKNYSTKVTTAYQISKLGLEVLKKIPEEYKQQVDKLITHSNNELLKVKFEDNYFLLFEPKSGYSRKSDITDCEDVSYVSSPYLPQCLRQKGGPEMTSNAHRAEESAKGITNIRDELTEVIHLKDGMHR